MQRIVEIKVALKMAIVLLDLVFVVDLREYLNLFDSMICNLIDSKEQYY